MKAKWIRLAIEKKVNEWVASIEDESLREMVKPNVIVTGGCIVSMLLGEKVNDFDLYLRNRECALALAKYYVEKFKKNPPTRFKSDGGKEVSIWVDDTEADRVKIVIKSAGLAGEDGSDDYQYFEGVHDGGEAQDQFLQEELGKLGDVADPSEVKDVAKAVDTKDSAKYRPIFLTANCVTLSDKVQVILRFFGEPEQIHTNYDFVHCTCHWDSKTRKLSLPPAALESILARDLRYLGHSKYPICAMVRIRKFLKRGWNMTAGQMLKIAWSINALNLKSIDVLEDQLIGVDTAYFVQLIEMMRKHDPDKIDSAYLIEVIDKIF